MKRLAREAAITVMAWGLVVVALPLIVLLALTEAEIQAEVRRGRK